MLLSTPCNGFAIILSTLLPFQITMNVFQLHVTDSGSSRPPRLT